MASDNNHISIGEFRALTGQTASGRNLRDVAMEVVGVRLRDKNAPQSAKTPARGRTARREAGKMNNLEARYAAQVLEPMKRSGEIIEYWFERFTFKIAQDCRYTPDFVLLKADGLLECHETKGFFEDDALVKIKVAADLFPFRFVAIQMIAKKHGGGWKEREF